MDYVRETLKLAKQGTNSAFQGKEPWQIVAITTTSVLSTVWLYEFLFTKDEDITVRTKKAIFRLVRQIPQLKAKVAEETAKASNEFNESFAKRITGQQPFPYLPETGLSDQAIVDYVEKHVDLGHYNWQEGNVSGAVYYFDQGLIDLVTKVYSIASYTNPLHSDIFPGINKMEAEVVRMTAALFDGGKETSGTMTTGGTESILLACKTYRDYAKEEKGISRPEMIVCRTVHSAFDKAGQYLKIKVRYIQDDPVTRKMDLKAMKKAINKNTIMIVGSAPNFPYGTMDDIEKIAEIGKSYNIPVHVDACLGGFVLALAKKAGYNVPKFSFELPGVTSISVDPHKYGFAPKGSSVILYSNRVLRHYQFCVTTDWPGGVYGTPTVGGSRAGGIIAATWATMLHFGLDGYVNATREILKTSKYIEEELRKMDGIFVFGTPVTSVIAFGSNEFDIFLLMTTLSELGWNLNCLQFPSGIHICVTYLHTKPGVADKLLNDIRSVLAKIMIDPKKPAEGMYAVYGASQGMPDRSIVGDVIKYFIESTYYIPETDAGIKEIKEKE